MPPTSWQSNGIMSHVSVCPHTSAVVPMRRRQAFFTRAYASGRSWSSVSPFATRSLNSAVIFG